MKYDRCVYCNSPDADTIDHVIAHSKWALFGKKRVIAYCNSNLVPCCDKCNNEKGDMLPSEWFKKHPEYKKTFKHNAKFLSNNVKAACEIF